MWEGGGGGRGLRGRYQGCAHTVDVWQLMNGREDTREVRR